MSINRNCLAAFNRHRGSRVFPDELQIIQQGKDAGHYGITARQPVTPERFQELLDQVEFEP